ncbi:hypothetical protein AMTRI_Chr04g248450 [Amborella trichopoda]
MERWCESPLLVKREEEEEREKGVGERFLDESKKLWRLCFNLGMGSGLETLCGQSYGAKQYHMLGIYLQRSWVIVTAVSLLFVPCYVFATCIFEAIGQPAELAVVAGIVALWSLPIHFSFIFSFTCQMYLQAHCAHWLMLGFGVSGVLASNIVAYWIPVVGQLIYIFGGGCPLTWTGFSMAAFHDLWPVLKLSLSSGVMICLEFSYTSILLVFTGNLADAKIAIDSLSICLNMNGWEMMIALGFLASASVRVANELGAGNARGAKFATLVVTLTSMSLGCVLWVLFIVFRKQMAYIFTNDEQVREAVINLSILLAFSVRLNSVQPVLSGVAIGAGWQSKVAYVNITCYYVIGIPLGLVLGYVLERGVKGIWIGMLCGTGAQTMVLAFMTYRTDWNKQVENSSARVNRWYQWFKKRIGDLDRASKKPIWIGESSIRIENQVNRSE